MHQISSRVVFGVGTSKVTRELQKMERQRGKKALSAHYREGKGEKPGWEPMPF
jgi:hypothetical protein